MLNMKISLTNPHNFVRHGLSCALISLCCCVFGFLSPAGAKTLPQTAKILPPRTIFLLDIEDFQQMRTQFEETSLYKLYKDPAMTAFAENAKAKLKERIQKLDDNDIFKTLFNTEIWPKGRVAFALVPDEQSSDFNEPQIVIITQWGEEIDKIKEAVNEMLRKNIDYGGHQKSSEDYRGVSIEISIDEASSEMSHCFIDDCFIAATKLDLLKFIIAHIKGASSPALGDDTDYTAAMKAAGPYHDIDVYINIKQIIKTILIDDPNGKKNELITNLGIDNVAAFGCSAGFARSPGVSSSEKAFLKINGTKKGICKMLETDSAVIKAPRFITEPTYSTTFFNLNIKKAYDELYNILYAFNPQHASMMSMLDLPDSPEGEPGVKLKSDVIAHLGSQIIFSQSINKPFSNTSVPTESLVALAVNNRDAVEKSLSLLHSKLLAPNDPDARRELLGYTIYLLPPTALPFLAGARAPMQTPSEPGAAQTTKLAFTITDSHLIFASEPVVERTIRALTSAGSPSVSSIKWFTAAKSAVPSAVGMATFQNNEASNELFWWMVKESGRPRSPANVGLMQFGELANFALLPEFDTVRKYFGVSAFYGISKPDGFLFELKYLNPQVTE